MESKRTTTGKLAAQPEHRSARVRAREARTQADRVRASLLRCPGRRG